MCSQEQNGSEYMLDIKLKTSWSHETVPNFEMVSAVANENRWSSFIFAGSSTILTNSLHNRNMCTSNGGGRTPRAWIEAKVTSFID